MSELVQINLIWATVVLVAITVTVTIIAVSIIKYVKEVEKK